MYKNGNTDNVENYRPVSLVSNPNKVFEKAKNILQFLEKNRILLVAKFGFKSNRGTQDATNVFQQSYYIKM